MTDEDKQNITIKFNDIVRNGIAPILKATGFRERGNNFHAHVGEMDYCINIQKDRRGFDDHFCSWRFTINICMTWADYTTSLFDKDCDFPLYSSCPLSARIGDFIGKGDLWITLHPNQDYTQTNEMICSVINDTILPILLNIRCLNDIWKYVKSHGESPESKDVSQVFYLTPIGRYMLYIATGRNDEAAKMRTDMIQNGASMELLDKVYETYKRRHPYETNR